MFVCSHSRASLFVPSRPTLFLSWILATSAFPPLAPQEVQRCRTGTDEWTDVTCPDLRKAVDDAYRTRQEQPNEFYHDQRIDIRVTLAEHTYEMFGLVDQQRVYDFRFKQARSFPPLRGCVPFWLCSILAM